MENYKDDSNRIFQVIRQLQPKERKKILVHTENVVRTNEKKQIEIVTNLVEAWYSLEQYIGLKEDKLSSTTVDFIRSEGNLETKHLYWFSKPKMC